MKEEGILAIHLSLEDVSTGQVEKAKFHLPIATMTDAISAMPKLQMYDENSIS